MFGVQKSLLAECCHRPLLFLSSWDLESLLQSSTSPITGVSLDHSCPGLSPSCCHGTHTFSSIPSLHPSSRSNSWTVRLIVSKVCLFVFVCFLYSFSPWISYLVGFVQRGDDISNWKKKLSYSNQFSVLKHSRLTSHLHREGRAAHLSPVDLRF